jgi:hypothetical protein
MGFEPSPNHPMSPDRASLALAAWPRSPRNRRDRVSFFPAHRPRMVSHDRTPTPSVSEYLGFTDGIPETAGTVLRSRARV